MGAVLIPPFHLCQVPEDPLCGGARGLVLQKKERMSGHVLGPGLTSLPFMPSSSYSATRAKGKVWLFLDWDFSIYILHLIYVFFYVLLNTK